MLRRLRVFVQDTIYDKFIEEAAKRFNAVKVACLWTRRPDGLPDQRAPGEEDPGVHRDRQGEGAKVACGGERATEGELAKGCFMKPTCWWT